MAIVLPIIAGLAALAGSFFAGRSTVKETVVKTENAYFDDSFTKSPTLSGSTATLGIGTLIALGVGAYLLTKN